MIFVIVPVTDPKHLERSSAVLFTLPCRPPLRVSPAPHLQHLILGLLTLAFLRPLQSLFWVFFFGPTPVISTWHLLCFYLPLYLQSLLLYITSSSLNHWGFLWRKYRDSICSELFPRGLSRNHCASCLLQTRLKWVLWDMYGEVSIFHCLLTSFCSRREAEY